MQNNRETDTSNKNKNKRNREAIASPLATASIEFEFYLGVRRVSVSLWQKNGLSKFSAILNIDLYVSRPAPFSSTISGI